MKSFAATLLVMLGVSVLGCERSLHERGGPAQPPDTLIVFQSTGNDLADIRLSVLEDSTFRFSMDVLPQPMEESDTGGSIRSIGQWANLGDGWLRLTFTGRRPILSAVFDRRYADTHQFTVRTDSTVDINSRSPELSLWGVVCTRLK